MKTINWNSTKEDDQIICKVAKRAIELFNLKDKQGIEMDITAVHLNDSPIRLNELLEADDFNFSHDIIGIMRNIDRTTGKLKNCFLPRFAR